MSATVIIPARLASTRFPGKALADQTGWPLVRHVWERARAAACASRVVVATDDERIREAVAAFGGEAVMTRADHPNGTSRLAEAAAVLGLAADDVVVNVQGDEPEVEPALIDAVAAVLRRTGAAVGTIALPFGAGEDPADPNLVKVVVGRDGRALYFSRALIPFVRDAANQPRPRALRHVGLYAYRRSFLDAYAGLEPTPLERAEALEQLRVLEHGHAIAVAVCDGAAAPGIDTPAQYEAFVRRWAARERRGLG